MGILNKGSSLLAGIGLGGAARAGAEPVLEVAKQNAWYRRQNKVVDPGTAAAASAQRLDTDQHFVSYDGNDNEIARSDQGATAVDLLDDTKRQGFSDERFNLARRLQQRVPSFSEALRLWRRKRIDVDTVNAILAREGIPPGLWPALRALYLELLDPQQLAAGIHRGLVDDPGLLKGEQPKPPFNVEAYPQYPIDALKEAQGSGYDRDRLGVLVGLQGLPMGVIEAAHAFYRKIITHGDYIRAFNTSNSRNEWAAAVLEYARQIPTARDFFENALRGYHDLKWAQEQAERHGMSHADSLVIYQNQGRPMNIRQITQALSRGGVFEPEPGELTDPYDASVVEGNIKPAYYKLAKALKYTLPSPFVMRSMAQTKVWSEAKTAKRLKDAGWIPQDADEAAAAWAGGTATTADPHVTKAHNSLWATMVQSYTAAESDAAALAPGFDLLNVPAAARTEVIAALDARRELIRKQLTPAQIKKAMSKAVPNEATGLPWSYDDALAALLSRGWPHGDASTFLKT